MTTDLRLRAVCSPYVIDHDLIISGNATLTIEPGVTVQMANGHVITVNAGKIVADGTADDPIVLGSTNASPSRGEWVGVNLTAGTASGTSFSFVTFDHGGQTGFGIEGCLFVNRVGANKVSVTDSTFVGCQQVAVTVRGAPDDALPFAAFAGNTFDDCERGLRLDVEVLDTVTSDQSYIDTPQNELVDGTLKHSGTLTAQGGTPWIMTGDLEVAGTTGATLTVEAGATLRFALNHRFAVGDGAPGTLIAVGTADAPIVIEATDPSQSRDSWVGMVLGTQAAAATTLRHVIVRGGGDTGFGMRGCVTVISTRTNAITIEDSSFVGCGLAGVGSITQGHTFASFARNTFNDDESGLWMVPSAAGSIAGTQTFVAVDENRMDGKAVTTNTTITGQTLPWHVMASDLDVGGPGNPTLTLGAGVVLQFDLGHVLEVGSGGAGGLAAAGTATSPVSIESSDPSHAPGGFIGIILGGNTLATTVLQHLRLAGGGQDNFARGCVDIRTINPGRVQILDSIFESCGQAAVFVQSPAMRFAAFEGNSFIDNLVGLHLPAATVASIGPNQIFEDTVENLLEGDTLEASAIWHPQSIPWHVLGDLEVDGAAHPGLTLEGGVSLLFDPGALLRIGGNRGGGLFAQGTAELPVIFDSSSPLPQPGSWVGILFGNAAQAGSFLDFAHIGHAGQAGFGANAAVDIAGIGSPLSITNSIFANNARGDIFVSCIAQLLENVFTGNVFGIGQVLEQNCD